MLTASIPLITLAAVLAAGPPGVELTAESARDAARIETVLADMTLREKAAQMVMPWIPGGAITRPADRQRIEKLVTTHRVGGFIVGRGAEASTARTLQHLQTLAGVPLLIGADVERGAGMRLVGATQLAPSMALGATGDVELAWRQGEATAAESRRAGIHLAFAPVADVNVNPRNPIINTRAFGSNARQVARFVRAYVEGLQDGGMLAVAKHFPGHGDTRTDSHLALPVISASRQRLDSVELVPFREAIAAGVAGIMTAHIALPSVTGTREPATLSRSVLTGLLREELGYEGLIVTDALNMAGVTRYAEGADVVLLSVLAGADILLQPRDPVLAIDVLEEAVLRGALTESRLDSSVRRILLAKERLGLTGARESGNDDPAGGALASRDAGETSRRNRALAAEIAERSITLVRDERGLVPATGVRSAVWIHYADAGATGTMALDAALRAEGWTVETIRIARGSTAARIAAAEQAARRPGRLVLMSSATQAVPWQGTTALPTRFRGLVTRLSASRPVVYISFGDPYLLGTFPDVSTYLLAWSDYESAQRAVGRALVGRSGISGKLPIELPTGEPLGFGLVRTAQPARDQGESRESRGQSR
ncbi:MAG TPA: glycoside hydrolase family 3 protein [Gemmatimonadaceae bacterium]|nr:glycoside hydrolase family 3 protein [Gemmatimonadaceae bacterium]